jgi:hypothetical protein
MIFGSFRLLCPDPGPYPYSLDRDPIPDSRALGPWTLYFTTSPSSDIHPWLLPSCLHPWRESLLRHRHDVTTGEDTLLLVLPVSVSASI